MKHTQSSFAGGEYSPAIWARVDLSKYTIGLMYCRNFFPQVYGGASNRPGLYFTSRQGDEDKKARMMSYIFSQAQAYALEFGENYVRFYTDQGQIAPDTVATWSSATAYVAYKSFVTVGDFVRIDCGSDRELYVISHYQANTINKYVKVATAADDNMSVTYAAATGVVTINLADTTPANNAADLIQVSLAAADTSFANYLVAENAAYAADRPVTLTFAATGFSPCDLTYYSKRDGTGFFPPVETTYWRAQAAYEIYSPYTEDDLPYLDITSSADVIYITCAGKKPQKLIRYGNANWEFSEYSPKDGPFLSENIDESISISAASVTGTGVTLSAASAVFDDKHVGALWKLIHYIEGQTAASSFTGTGTGTGIKCFTTWRLISHGTWTGKFKVEKSTDGGTTWTNLRSFSSADDFNVDTSGTEDITVHDKPFLVRVNMHAYTSGTCNVDLTTDAFYQHGVVEITSVVASTEAQGTVLEEIGATTNTISWAEGAWSDYRGYPAVNTFHEDRLAMAGTTHEPMTVHATRTANYESFKRNIISLQDTDALSLNLISRQVNPVNGIVPLGDLLAFTTGSEWRIGTDGEAFTPLTARAKVQGYRGSVGVKPVVIGNQVIFVQSNGKVVRNFGYNDETNSFMGIDLRVLAEHLFGSEIVDMAYQQDPDYLIWVLLKSGELLTCTYLTEEQVIAWAKHPTEGEVESICVIPADGYDELWLTVNRANGRFVERMVERMASVDPQDQFFVDSGLTMDTPISISGITQASPGRVTCSAAHGFKNLDYIDITEVAGMTELNDKRYRIKNVSSTAFDLADEETLDDISTADMTAYVSGGVVRGAYTEITGLDHLEGQEVAILGNGEKIARDTVSGGKIILPLPCSRVHIGLPYNCDLGTLDVHLALRDGNLQGRKVKIGNIQFRFLNSRGGYIGPDEDHLHEEFVPNRWREGTPPALFTGLSEWVNLGAGYSDGARVFFRQSAPLPVTILSVTMELEAGD